MKPTLTWPLALAALIAAGASPWISACQPAEDAGGPPPAAGRWPMGGQNLSNTRHAEKEKTISTANVATLAPRWTLTTAGDISTNPAVVEGALYVPDWAGNLSRIDADDGAVVWSRSIADYTGVPGAISRTTPAVHGNTVVLGTQKGGDVLAVDKNTGDLLWKTRADPHVGAIITQSPVIHGDTVYVGVSSNEEVLATDPAYVCCSFRGSVIALDRGTGALKWRTYTVPEGYTGGAVWGSTPVVDVKRGSLYITTGNNYSAPPEVEACAEAAAGDPEAQAACMAPDNYIDAVLSLDLETGAIRWSRRLQGWDAYTIPCDWEPPGTNGCPSPVGPDYDFGSGANLYEVESPDGSSTELLGAGQKSGIYWALDPDDGEVVWGTSAGPGGDLGGIMWGSATDGRRVYTAITNSRAKPITLASGQTIDWGLFTALDAATGDILWQTPDPIDGAQDFGPVTVANGVVFACSLDPLGHMYAFDAATGQVLWSFASGGSCLAGASVVDGVVYWGSGYSSFEWYGATGNNKLYAFSIDGR